MDDLLKKSALAYQELMPYRYHITLGKRGRSSKILIRFPEVAYHHLAGFHKTSFDALVNKSEALSAVLDGAVTHEHFLNAGYSLEDRWRGICCLKETIETNRAVFHYRARKQRWSCIEADYLMVNGLANFFIAGDSPESIFERSVSWDYAAGCPRMTTLQIVREEVSSGKCEMLFQADSYRPCEPSPTLGDGLNSSTLDAASIPHTSDAEGWDGEPAGDHTDNRLYRA